MSDFKVVSLLNPFQSGVLGLSAGTTNVTTGTVVFSNANGVTFGLNGSTVTASVAAGGGTVNFSAGTTSSGLASVVFSNSNGVSFGLNGATITGTVKTDYLTTAMLSNAATISNINLSAGTTSNNLSALVLSNSNNVSFGLNGSTLTATITVPAQTNQTLGIYASSNTTMTSSGTLDARSLTFRGIGIASVGYSANEVLISVPAGAPSPVNVSAGTTSSNLGSVVFSDSNRVSFGLNGSTITAKHALNVSAGTTSNDISNGITFSNSNGVSFGLNGSTLTASVNAGGGAPVVSQWPLGYAPLTSDAASVGASAGTGGSTQWTATARLWSVAMPWQVEFATVARLFTLAATSAGTGSATQGWLVGIYTLNANTAMSLVSSFVGTHAMSQNSITARSHRWGWGTNSDANSTSVNGNLSDSFSGVRQISLHGTPATLSASNYYFGAMFTQRTSNANVYSVAGDYFQGFGSSTTAVGALHLGLSATAAPHWLGIFTTSSNGSAISNLVMPASIHTSAISVSGGTTRSFIPWVAMHRSVT